MSTEIYIVKSLKQSVRKLEIKYNITIDDNQLAFIVRMVIENSISV